MKKFIRLITSVGAILALGLLAACGANGQQANSKTVRVGIVGADKRLWNDIATDLKAEGITLKIVTFTDYTQPNTALSDHQIDINAFQHQYYLDNWNKAHKSNIVGIGNTVLAPIALYSNSIKKVADFKKGDEISIPNDATNEGRALHLLARENLIELNDTALPTPKDITKNPLHLKITPLEASQTARSLSDVSAAVVNDSVASDANLSFDKIVAKEAVNKDSAPYINLIAANKSEAKNKTYLKVVKAYQTKKNAQRIKELYKGRDIPAWNLKLK